MTNELERPRARVELAYGVFDYTQGRRRTTFAVWSDGFAYSCVSAQDQGCVHGYIAPEKLEDLQSGLSRCGMIDGPYDDKQTEMREGGQKYYIVSSHPPVAFAMWREDRGFSGRIHEDYTEDGSVRCTFDLLGQDWIPDSGACSLGPSRTKPCCDEAERKYACADRYQDQREDAAKVPSELRSISQPGL